MASKYAGRISTSKSKKMLTGKRNRRETPFRAWALADSEDAQTMRWRHPDAKIERMTIAEALLMADAREF